MMATVHYGMSRLPGDNRYLYRDNGVIEERSPTGYDPGGPYPPPPEGSYPSSPGGSYTPPPCTTNTLPEGAATSLNPLLQYEDPYHNTTVNVDPLGLGSLPLFSERVPYDSSVPSPQMEDTLHCNLDYQDFIPTFSGYHESGNLRCVSNFRSIINSANDWLRQNPQLEVRSCENIVWSTDHVTQVENTETVVLDRCPSTPLEGDTYYVIGLRLWVVTKQNKTVAQRINFCDFKAKDKEKLNTVVARANHNLQVEPLDGPLISIETVLVPNFSSWDPERVFWRESQCHQGRYNMFLRLYYTQSTTPTHCQQIIGYKNIVPDMTQCGPEPFSSLVKRASRWISGCPSLRVTNLKSVYISWEGDSSDSGADRCVHYFRDFGYQQYFQLLRIFYVKKTAYEESVKTPLINCMTFTPVQTTLGPNTSAAFEHMRHTMMRIASWMHLAGADVRSVESFITPMISSAPNHTLPEVTYWNPMEPHTDGHVKKYLMHIRLYIEGEFVEPDPQLLPPLPYSLTEAMHSSLQQYELDHFYKQKKKRSRRRRILIFVFLVVIIVAASIILLDQAFDFFKK